MVLNRVAMVGLLFGGAGAGACTSVRRVQPVAYLEDNAPPVVWVTYANNTVIPVAQPEIRRDTLRGTLQGARVKIPMGEIRSVEAKVPDHRKTALLLTTLGVVAVSSVYFVWVAQAGGPGGGDAVYCGVDVKGRVVGFC